jgi:hypothetical protein
MLFDARRDIAAKQVGTELILYDSANRDLHVLNATAAKVFQLCDGSHTPEEIAEALLESFDGVERAQAYEDVKRTLDILEAKHLVSPKNKAVHHLGK